MDQEKGMGIGEGAGRPLGTTAREPGGVGTQSGAGLEGEDGSTGLERRSLFSKKQRSRPKEGSRVSAQHPGGRDAGTEPTAVGGAVEPAHFPPQNPMKAFLGLQPRPLPELSRSTNTRGAGADRRGRGRERAELSERAEVVAEPRGGD